MWRHRLGTRQSDDERVYHEADERFYVSVGSTRSDEWIIIHAGSKLSTEEWLIPAADAGAEPRVVVPRRPDVEYQLDHWGDRFVVLTNEDAVDFRVMEASIEAPGEWTELDRPRTGPAHHRRRAVRRVPRPPRVERRPAADPDPRPIG